MSDATTRARCTLAAAFFVSMLIGLTCIGRAQSLEMDLSAIAMIGLLAGGLLFERAVVAAWKGTLTRQDGALAGALLGLPLSFFFLQTKTAQATGDLAIVRGASRTVLAVGILVVVVSVVGEWRRRSQRT